VRRKRFATFHRGLREITIKMHGYIMHKKRGKVIKPLPQNKKFPKTDMPLPHHQYYVFSPHLFALPI
jgi:hypothetical protein